MICFQPDEARDICRQSISSWSEVHVDKGGRSFCILEMTTTAKISAMHTFSICRSLILLCSGRSDYSKATG